MNQYSLIENMEQHTIKGRKYFLIKIRAIQKSQTKQFNNILIASLRVFLTSNEENSFYFSEQQKLMQFNIYKVYINTLAKQNNFTIQQTQHNNIIDNGSTMLINSHQAKKKSISLPKISSASNLAKNINNNKDKGNFLQKNNHISKKFASNDNLHILRHNQQQEQDTYSDNDIKKRTASQKLVNSSRVHHVGNYASEEERRRYKNQKIHLNLLQRKLLTGTYDEVQQTSANLNIVKKRSDELKLKQQKTRHQILKLTKTLQDTKTQIQKYEKEQGSNDEVIYKLQKNVQKQLHQTQKAKIQRLVFQHMILQRKSIDFNLSAKQNNRKSYLKKLHNQMEIINIELRQHLQKAKNYQFQLQKIKDDHWTQRRQRQHDIYDKQSSINKRIQKQFIVEQKSKAFIDELQQNQQNIQIEDHNEVYFRILSEKLLQEIFKWRAKKDIDTYYDLEQKYKKVARNKAFLHDEPHTFVQRFFQSKEEIGRYQQIIKSRQLKLKKVQEQNQKLKKEYEKVKLQGNDQQRSINFNSEVFGEQGYLKSQYQKGALKKYLQRKSKQDHIERWVNNQWHQLIQAEVLITDERGRDIKRVNYNNDTIKMMNTMLNRLKHIYKNNVDQSAEKTE